MKWKTALSTMKPYKPGRSIEDVKRSYGLTDVNKLASNENPYGCSPAVVQFLQEHTHELAIYPDSYTAGLRKKLAARHQISEDAILFGNGSDEIVTIISRSLLQPGTNTIMASVTFPQYAHNAKVEGAEIREVPMTENGDHDLDGFLAAIDEQTAVIWVCNPNNPTGNLIPADRLRAFLDQVPEQILVVLDEAYFEYVTDPAHEDSMAWLKQYANIIILRTFSKAYGLASFRIGYGAASPQVITELNKVRNPFNNSTIALTAAEIALEDQDFLEQCRQENSEQRKRFVEYANTNSLRIYPSETNFVLMEVPMDADEASEQLLANGYIVRSGNALGTPGYVRVTVGTEEQNTGFFQAFDQLLLTKERSL